MLDLIGVMVEECLFLLGYVTGRSEFPRQLPRKEEEALILRMADGDEEARQRLMDVATDNVRQYLAGNVQNNVA